MTAMQAFTIEVICVGKEPVVRAIYEQLKNQSGGSGRSLKTQRRLRFTS
jgi:hypothetical protein